jgi:tetratricopeptide (TPR) repeat protein
MMRISLPVCFKLFLRKAAPWQGRIAGIWVALLTVATLAACEKVDRSDHMRVQIAKELLNKSVSLAQQGKTAEALAVHEEIERYFGQDPSPGVRMQVAMALFNKGVSLGKQGKLGEKLATYEEIDRRFGQDVSPGVRKLVARALFNKGVTLGEQGKSAEAFAVFEEIDRRFGQDASPDVREQVANAIFNKSVVLWRQGKAEEALAIYEEIERRFGQDTSPGVRLSVVSALVNEAVTLFESNDAAGALAVSDSALARCGNFPPPVLQKQCFYALEASVAPLLALGKPRDAAQRIRQVQKQLSTTDGDRAIMTFLLWLAEAQTPEQTVREAIRALPSDVQFGWTFDSIRPFVLDFPAPRKARAQCFFAFFEQHRDAGKLDACLGAVD